MGEQEGGGTISHSYATGSVEGNSSVGGLVGYQKQKEYPLYDKKTFIINSYATGNVNGNEM